MRLLWELPSQVLLTFKICIYLTFLVELIIIVGSQIFENNTFLEDMVNRNQHGMGDCHICTFWSAMSTDSHILRIEIGFLILYSSMCTGD